MSIRNEPAADGTPCWADLASPDPKAAHAFYSHLFDWTIVNTGPEMGHYGLCNVGGQTAAGIGPKQPGDLSPPAWITYLATGDVAKTGDVVTAAGGTILAGPMDIGDEGRMLMAMDPTGAVFGAWQAGTNIGTSIVGEPGAIGWCELRTRDPERAQAFYGEVFGYQYSRLESEFDYVTIDGPDADTPLAGMGAMPAGMPDDVPSHWMTYFVVADTDEAAARVTIGGGSIVAGPFDTSYGRTAVARDPSGASFSLIGMMPDPARQM